MNRNSRYPAYYWLTTFTLILTIAVGMLGAYTRLSDAGLSCPDWPGCYETLILPKDRTALAQAQQTFPKQPLITAKAWKEMLHRYLAATLGFLIALLALWSIARRRKNPSQNLWVPCLLVAAVAFQIILGMWTISLKLLPLVVAGHLMGGMTIAALLAWLWRGAKPKGNTARTQRSIKFWAMLGFLILLAQIFLGAWTSTNYAALACPHFPFCHGNLFPALDWGNAFNFVSPIGPNYEGGHLTMNARVTIQMVHRYGAFITAAFWIPFALYLMCNKINKTLRPWGYLILTLLGIQFVLGVLNVVKLLPIHVAVSHNGLAMILLISIVALLHKLIHHHQEPLS